MGRFTHCACFKAHFRIARIAVPSIFGLFDPGYYVLFVSFMFGQYWGGSNLPKFIERFLEKQIYF
ncbi:hypothetical protein C7N43_12735 [Sphingobacteriales bacterium UPWRP_1]|nr:hypothetical protein C7N43_12735 [Sphingobacteriales bacterium UPWRP_1]